MSKKYKIISILIVILVVVGLILIFIPGRKKGEKGLAPTLSQRDLAQKKAPVSESQISPEKQIERTLFSRARNFASRYGSYSTDANFQNLYELRSEVTPRFWQEIERTIHKGTVPEGGLSPTGFYGITTKALSVKLEGTGPEGGLPSNKAEFLVSCQRQETKGTEKKVLYQALKIIFVPSGTVPKEGLSPISNWLVDSAEWQ